jgi:hypothetical protein
MTFDPGDDDREPFLDVSMRLRQYMPWYKRVYVGVGFILGKDWCAYGEYDGMNLELPEAIRMRNLLNQYIAKAS